MSTAHDVLEFWFGDRARKLWFAKDTAFDDEIRARFGADVEAAARGERDAWCASADGALAAIVLLDQFSRNIHRGSPLAFGNDGKARELAARAVDAGHDLAVALDRRVFFYLPFEHSESLADQDRGLELFRRWVDAYAAEPAAARKDAEDEYGYAVRHREIIKRFGRFPHRNAVLGRASTAEELAFLAQPGSSF